MNFCKFCNMAKFVLADALLGKLQVVYSLSPDMLGVGNMTLINLILFIIIINTVRHAVMRQPLLVVKYPVGDI